MTGMLPDGCKTVNEAAAWAAKETGSHLIKLTANVALMILSDYKGGLSEAQQAAETMAAHHGSIINWLSQRNDRIAARLREECGDEAGATDAM